MVDINYQPPKTEPKTIPVSIIPPKPNNQKPTNSKFTVTCDMPVLFVPVDPELKNKIKLPLKAKLGGAIKYADFQTLIKPKI